MKVVWRSRPVRGPDRHTKGRCSNVLESSFLKPHAKEAFTRFVLVMDGTGTSLTLGSRRIYDGVFISTLFEGIVVL